MQHLGVLGRKVAQPPHATKHDRAFLAVLFSLVAVVFLV